MEMTRYPRLTLICKLQRSVYAVVVKRLKGTSSDAPYIRQIEYLQSLATLFLCIDHADTIITLVLLGKLTAHLCQRLGRSNTNTYRYICPKFNAFFDASHEFNKVKVLLIAIQIKE